MAKCEIRGFRVVKVDCNVSWTPENSEINIKIEEKLACRKPLDPSNVSGLLEIETIITSDDSEDFKIYLLSQAIFSFDEMPEDFERTLQNECYSIAKGKVYAAIKGITSAMELTPLDLNDSGE